MGKAFSIAEASLEGETEQLEGLRVSFLDGLSELSGITLNGSEVYRVPGIVNLSVEGVDAESLMLGLRGLAVSSGSACASAAVEPSYVLRGIGLSDELANRALRFSIGRYTTVEEIAFASAQIVDVVTRLRAVR